MSEVLEELKIKARTLVELVAKWVSEGGPRGLEKHNQEIYHLCSDIAETLLKPLKEYHRRMQVEAEKIEAEARSSEDPNLLTLATSLKTLYRELELVTDVLKHGIAFVLALFTEVYVPLQYEISGLELILGRLLEIQEKIVEEFENRLREQEIKRGVERYTI